MSPVSAEEPSGTFRYTPHCYYFIYLFILFMIIILFIYLYFFTLIISCIYFFINCALVYINFLRILCLFAFVIDIFTTTSITLCIYLYNNIFTLGLVFHIKLIFKKTKNKWICHEWIASDAEMVILVWKYELISIRLGSFFDF